jgi:hypothetical protein
MRSGAAEAQPSLSAPLPQTGTTKPWDNAEGVFDQPARPNPEELIALVRI